MRLTYIQAAAAWGRSMMTIAEALHDERLLGAAIDDITSWRTWLTVLKAAYVAQRIVEFHERGSHGLHCAKRGVEPLLHRLDPTRGGQRLVGAL